jgi:hypothetical protein
MQESIEDRKSSVLNALEAWIVDKCRTLDTNPGEYGNGGKKKILDEYPNSSDRLAKYGTNRHTWSFLFAQFLLTLAFLMRHMEILLWRRRRMVLWRKLWRRRMLGNSGYYAF